MTILENVEELKKAHDEYIDNGEHMIIHVSKTANTTPLRFIDYEAIFDGYDGAPDAGHQCHGIGANKQEAVINLLSCCGDL